MKKTAKEIEVHYEALKLKCSISHWSVFFSTRIYRLTCPLHYAKTVSWGILILVRLTHAFYLITFLKFEEENRLDCRLLICLRSLWARKWAVFQILVQFILIWKIEILDLSLCWSFWYSNGDLNSCRDFVGIESYEKFADAALWNKLISSHNCPMHWNF